MNEAPDFASFLVEQGSTSASAFHEFRLAFGSDKQALHLFVEGHADKMVFTPMVRQQTGKFICSYVCGGKKQVLAVRDTIRRFHFKGACCAFIVDRDYDDLFMCQAQCDKETYLTDGYSVENEIVNELCVKDVLAHMCEFQIGEQDLLPYIQSFNRSKSSFFRLIEPLLVWALALRANGVNPNFNNVNLGRVFTLLPSGEVRRTPGGGQVFRRAITSQTTSVNAEQLRAWQRY